MEEEHSGGDDGMDSLRHSGELFLHDAHCQGMLS